MKKIISVIALSASTMLLSACGGGGGDSSSGTPTVAATSTAANSLNALNGTYVLACTDETYKNGPAESSQGTLTVESVGAGNKATAHFQYYKGSANCAPATIDTDATIDGPLNGKSSTKNYTDATGKTLTANVVNFGYANFTLARGNLTVSLPTPGATTDIAYVLDGKKLYLAKGHREADGLGDSLSRDILVKQ